MDKSYQELSRAVFPNINTLDNTDLFYNNFSKSIIKNGESDKYSVLRFNTWMNSFPVKKYFDYCEISDLYLHLNININAVVNIYNYSYNTAFDISDLIQTENISAGQDAILKIENPEKYENLYFEIISKESDDIVINKASWCTTTSPLKDNKLAIVICTFKRENYVKKNIELFKQFIKENSGLSSKFKMFVIDNGSTLDKSLANEYIEIISNKNSGGAGGFTRGIIEAINSDIKYDRILLMDDDVEIFAESFYRTLILSNYLKPEYSKSFIHGAMLNLYKKDEFFENAAIQTSTWVKSYHKRKTSVLPQQNIAQINYIPKEIFEDENKRISSAWWYCCFSVESVKEKGLPLPVFFRCDDIEWSWRNFGEHHISMNGICVWHTPFEWRVSKPVDYYFTKRNIFMVNMVYTKNYKKTLLRTLRKDFKRLLRHYDYTSCNIYLRMMQDLLRGKTSFTQDSQNLLKEIFEYTKSDKTLSVSDIQEYKKVINRYKNYCEHKSKYKQKYILKSLLFFITFEGRLLPNFLWNKQRDTWSNRECGSEFYLEKRVNVINFLTNKYEQRDKSWKTENALKKDFKKLYQEINKNYEKLTKTFKEMQKECSTEGFWRMYLEI